MSEWIMSELKFSVGRGGVTRTMSKLKFSVRTVAQRHRANQYQLATAADNKQQKHP